MMVATLDAEQVGLWAAMKVVKMVVHWDGILAVWTARSSVDSWAQQWASWSG